MRRIAAAFALLLCAFTMHAQAATENSRSHVTLKGLRDEHRALLIFAPATNAPFLAQIRALAASEQDLHERDLVVVPILLQDDNKPWGVSFHTTDIGILPPAEQAATRTRFHIPPAAFTVILIGKDGGEKLRSSAPLPMDKLLSTIDAMPMRQDEMRQQPKP